LGSFAFTGISPVIPVPQMNTRVLLSLTLAVSCGLAAEYKPLEDPRRPIATTQSVPGPEAPAKMTLPQGFHAQLVASEPDIVQPVAYNIDDRGRLWVIQNTNYPVCPGEPKDQIVIFEDFGPDGKA